MYGLLSHLVLHCQWIDYYLMFVNVWIIISSGSTLFQFVNVLIVLSNVCQCTDYDLIRFYTYLLFVNVLLSHLVLHHLSMY